MKASPLILSLVGSGVATFILVSYYVRYTRQKDEEKTWAESINPFAALRRVRSCKDASSYKDVVCQGSPKRVQISPECGAALVMASSESATDLSSAESVDTQSTSLSAASSYTSLESEESSIFCSPRANPSSSSVSSESDDISKDTSGVSQHDHEDNIHIKNDSLSLDINNEAEFHELLRSPIVETHPVDDRMLRCPESPVSPIVQDYVCPTVTSEVELKAQAIYTTYNSIVPPLRPITGETICKSK